jgi:hypothetical protein
MSCDICARCGERITRHYSIASTDGDDYLASCGCFEWEPWAGALLLLALFVALGVLL